MTDIRTLHRSADLELADEGGIAPLEDDVNLREPRKLTRLQDIDPWALAGVALLVLGAIGTAGVLAWAAAWVLRAVA